MVPRRTNMDIIFWSRRLRRGRLVHEEHSLHGGWSPSQFNVTPSHLDSIFTLHDAGVTRGRTRVKGITSQTKAESRRTPPGYTWSVASLENRNMTARRRRPHSLMRLSTVSAAGSGWTLARLWSRFLGAERRLFRGSCCRPDAEVTNLRRRGEKYPRLGVL